MRNQLRHVPNSSSSSRIPSWSIYLSGTESTPGLFTEGSLTQSQYLGWIEDDEASGGKRQICGELVETNYVLRHSMKMEQCSDAPHATNATNRQCSMDRMGKMSRMGYDDALA